jgi:hypothetical protein
MYVGILGLHSLLRWVLIIFLIVNIFRHVLRKNIAFDASDKKWSVLLIIATHTNLLAAIYLYFFGENGLKILEVQKYTMKDVMKTSSLRFWIVEHPTMMLLTIILITIGHIVSKKDIVITKKRTIIYSLFSIAFIMIIAAAPWPFRMDGIARPIFRALY